MDAIYVSVLTHCNLFCCDMYYFCAFRFTEVVVLIECPSKIVAAPTFKFLTWFLLDILYKENNSGDNRRTLKTTAI